MEINSLGMYKFDTTENPFSASAVKGFQSGNNGDFEEMLKNARKATVKKADTERIDNDISAPILKKGEIDKTDKLYELCAELETFLLKNLIKSMRSTVQKSNLIETGFAGEIYEDMLYDEYTKAYAQNANFGFAEMAYKDLAGLR